MKYTIIEHLYSHETETKISRRHKLCLRIIHNFNYEDLGNINFLNISKQLKVERKTLYNYFQDRDELLIVIALCLLEDIHKIKLQEVKKLKKQDLTEQEYLIQLLYNALDNIVFLKKSSLHYLKQFDSLEIPINTSPKYSQLFQSGIDFLKKKYGIIEPELRRAIANNILVSPIDQTDDDLIFTIIESGYSYQAKLLSMKNLSNSDISKYLLQYIQLLVYAYTK